VATATAGDPWHTGRRVAFKNNHRQKWDAAIAKFKFCASRIVNVVIPMRLPRSSNTPPPLQPGETGAVIWMYSMPFSDRRNPDTKPSPSVLIRPSGDPMVKTASPTDIEA